MKTIIYVLNIMLNHIESCPVSAEMWEVMAIIILNTFIRVIVLVVSYSALVMAEQKISRMSHNLKSLIFNYEIKFTI